MVQNISQIASRLMRPKIWALLLLIYCLVHIVLRLLLSNTFQVDGAEQVVDSQFFQLSYGNFQPPLVTWFFWALWQLIDPSLYSFVITRYVVIFGILFLWFLISKELFRDVEWQLVASTSWLLLYPVVWQLLQGSTHTTLLSFSILLGFYAFLKIIKTNSNKWLVFLGLSMGLGISSKYSYALFPLVILPIFLFNSGLRRKIFSQNILLIIGPAILFGLPAFLSLYDTLERVTLQAGEKTQLLLGGLLRGDASFYVNFIGASAEFLAPLWLLVIPILFLSKNQEPSSEESIFNKIFLVYAAACFITVLVVGLVWGSQTLKARWLHPLLLIAPFAILYWASRKQLRERSLKIYVLTVLVFGLLVLFGRVWQLSLTPYFGKGSRVTIPIQECVSHISNQDLESYPEICASDNFLAAHLRVNNPNAIVRVGNDCGKEVFLRKLYWMENEKNKPSGMVQLCHVQKGKHSVSVFHF